MSIEVVMRVKCIAITLRCLMYIPHGYYKENTYKMYPKGNEEEVIACHYKKDQNTKKGRRREKERQHS